MLVTCWSHASRQPRLNSILACARSSRNRWLAASLETVDTLSDLSAAVGGTLQIYVWPGLLWVAMQYMRVDTRQHGAHESSSAGWRPTSLPRGGFVHCVLGVVLSLAGLVVATCGVVGVAQTEI